MLRSIVLASLVLAVFALLSGCATITRGSTQDFTVDSDPQGARVAFSNGGICETPCTVEKQRKYPFTVTVEKECHEPVTAHVTSSVATSGAVGMAGNALIGGVIGIGVDVATGATKDLQPNPLFVELVALAGCESNAEVTVAQQPEFISGKLAAVSSTKEEGVEYLWLTILWKGDELVHSVENPSGLLIISDTDNNPRIKLDWVIAGQLDPDESLVDNTGGIALEADNPDHDWMKNAEREDVRLQFRFVDEK